MQFPQANFTWSLKSSSGLSKKGIKIPASISTSLISFGRRKAFSEKYGCK